MDKSKKILIVGLGLIGGSYAMALKQQGYYVTAIDINQRSIDYALENNIIDAGAVSGDGVIDLAKAADVIIFGLYPTAMVEWVFAHQKHFKSGAIITDVSGVKCKIIDTIEKTLREDIQFIGSHPMAGREVSGVENSNTNMFKQANFIITPTQKNTQNAIDFAKKLAEILGFKRIVILSPEKHDEMIGYLSQLTHAIAVSLMNANGNPDLKQYTGDSFRDLTRIAKINENLWSELFFLNKDVLVSEIDCFISALENLKSKLVFDDEDGLKKLFIQSTERRKHFDE